MRKSKDTGITVRKGSGLASNPWSPFAWFDEMDRWFDELHREFEWSGWPLASRSALGEGARRPVVDIRDTGPEFVVTAEVPGVAKENLVIQTTPDSLEIKAELKGERKEKKADYYHRERSYGSWYRTVALPVEVVPDKVSASLTDGVLEIRLPKREPTPEEKPVNVKVE